MKIRNQFAIVKFKHVIMLIDLIYAIIVEAFTGKTPFVIYQHDFEVIFSCVLKATFNNIVHLTY